MTATAPATATRPAAFDKRLVAHMPMLKKLAAKHCHRNEREEVVQETIASALASWHLFREDGSFYKWLYWRFRGVCREMQDKRARNVVRADSDAITMSSASAPARQENIVYAGQVVRRLSRSRGGRMLTRIGAGETLAEVGKRRGITGNRVQQLTARARARLMKVAA